MNDLKLVRAAVASDRATRWGYRASLNRDNLAEYLRQMTEEDENLRADVAVAATQIERVVLLRVADKIEQELICCDVYERDKGTWRAGRRHAICFWAGAAREIVLDEIGRQHEDQSSSSRSEVPSEQGRRL